MEKSCFFIGHRDSGEEIYPVLCAEIERHITECGVMDFFVGHYGAFDRMAAQAVKEAKHHHSEVRLWLVLPYHPAMRSVEVPEGFDGTYYPWEEQRIPRRLAIVKTNRCMVDKCGYLIACVRYSVGNSAKVLEYAEKKAKQGLISAHNIAALEAHA